MKGKLIFILAIIFGSIAAFGAFQYMQNLENTYQLSGNYTQVATAKSNIPARTAIQGDMLEFIEIPVEYVQEGSVMTAAEAVGKLARNEIYAGEQLLAQKLMERQDHQGGLAVKVEEGKRAVTIPIGMVSSLHGMIQVGDRVDVMITLVQEEERSVGEGTDTAEHRRIAVTVLQNLPVLAMNNRMTEAAEGTAEPATITLMVTPEEAQRVVLANQTGSIQLTLRGPEDDTIISIPMMDEYDLLR
mgnify:CR=1 FL=1